MASRNGLNPKIKGPRGVGFGRALPAAFGFDNGIQPDGNDDYMTIPGLVDTAFPDKATVEFWTYKDTSAYGYCISILDTTTNQGFNFSINGESRIERFDISNGTVSSNYVWPSADDGLKTHVVFVIDQANLENSGNAILYIDGVPFSTFDAFNSHLPATIKKFELFRYAPYSSLNSNYKFDEVRFYKTALRPDQVTLNYNQRNGNNPCETENLLAWYKFETIDLLDFSTLQDGSDIRFGVRDFSMKNNHAQQMNMDINPESSNFVLKPF